MFKNILVTLDGSTRSEQVLPMAKELLGEGQREVTLFTVGEPPKATVRRRRGSRRPVPLATATGAFPSGSIPAVPITYAESRDQAVERRDHELLEYLEEAGRSLAETGLPFHTAVHFGEPAAEIIHFARQRRVDLIVMATHGRSGLRGTLRRSVTAEVIRSGVAPVLVVRPKRRRRARQSP